MKKGLVRCWVHGGDPLPAELTHQHHKIPRAAGGPDIPSNLVNICPVCHNAVDRGANYICKGKSGMALNMIEQFLPNDLDARSRLTTLVNTQAKAWKLPGGQDQRRVTLHLSVETHKHLKLLASTVKKKRKSGKMKTMGVTEYMERVLVSHVEQKVREGLLPPLEKKEERP